MSTLPARVPTPDSTPASSSLIYIVDDPYGSPVDNATTLSNLPISNATQLALDDKTDLTALPELVEDIIGTKVVAGSNVTVTYNDTTGETTIASTGGGGGSPGGSTTQVQYNDTGSFAGDAAFTYDSVGKVLSVGTDADNGTVETYGLVIKESVNDTASVINASGVTVSRTLTIPDADGQIALTADIPTGVDQYIIPLINILN